MGGADIVAHRDKTDLLAARIFVVDFLALGLLGVLNDDAVILLEIIQILRHAVDFDVGRTDEGHDVEAPDLDSLEIRLAGLLELHRDVCLEPKQIG